MRSNAQLCMGDKAGYSVRLVPAPPYPPPYARATEAGPPHDHDGNTGLLAIGRLA